MEPQFVSRGAFSVMGVQERFTPGSEDFEGIWMNRFMPVHDRISPHSLDKAYYGVCFGVPEDPKAMDYFAGVAVAEGADCPEGLVIREVPAARYAVFQ